MNKSNERMDDLLYRYLDNECASSEIQEVEEWLKDEKNKTQFDEIQRLHERVGKANESEKIDVDVDLAWENIMTHMETFDEYEESSSFSSVASESMNRFLKYAAIIVIAVGLSYFFFNNNNQDKQTIAVVSESPSESEEGLSTIAMLEKEDVKTPDGSEVSIKKGSSLNYPKKFGKETREVELKGEAYFDIVKDEESPYLINVGDATVKVLGTSFLVKELDDIIEVKVKEGNVKFYPTANESKAIEIGKGEHGIYIRSDGTLTKTDLTSHNFASWRNNVLRFNGTNMTDVVRDLEKHYGVQIELANSNVSNCTLTGQYRDKSIGEVLDNIKNSFAYQIKEQDGVIIIDGEGCAN